jgi:hypothetical protein
MGICLSNLFFLRQNNLKLAVNLLIAGIITVGNARAELPLRINEIMAANSNTLADEDMIIRIGSSCLIPARRLST